MGLKNLATRAAIRVGNIFTATDGRDILRNIPDGWEVERPNMWFDGPAEPGQTIYGNPPPGAMNPNWGNVLPAMARCRSLICDALGGVPWQVFRGLDQVDTPDWLTDPQGNREIASIMTVKHSAVEFWSTFFLSALELGEGVIYVGNRGSDHQPEGPLFLINPTELHFQQGEWVINNVVIDPDELIIMRNRVVPGSLRGIGIWQQFGNEVGYGGAIRDYSGNMLGKGIPNGYLKVTAPDLSPIEASNLKKKWMDAHGGSDRSIAVLNAVTDFTPLELDPKAVQLAELFRLSGWQIAMMYGIPPYKLGISMGYNNTYANIESAGIDYVQDALLPWSRRAESTFDSQLPDDLELKLNLDGLRRADTKSRYEAHKIGLDAGFLTKNEVRAMEDLPPLPGGDELASVTELQAVPNFDRNQGGQNDQQGGIA